MCTDQTKAFITFSKFAFVFKLSYKKKKPQLDVDIYRKKCVGYIPQ